MPNPLYDALIGPHSTSDAVFLHLACGSDVSFRAFADMAGRMAAALAAAGLAKGDRVAVQVEKSAPALAVYAACVQRGLVFLPLNTAYTGAELTYFMTDSGARALICDAAAAPALAPVAAQTPATLMSMAADGTLDTGAPAPPCPDKVIDCSPDDLAAILYTSGTTGRSKGAMLTHRNLLSNAQSLCDIWEITDADRLLHALPIFHTHGLFVAINTSLLAGASVIFLPRLDMDDLIRWLPHATTMMGVPTFYTRMLADPRVTHDLVAHMRLFISGSAPLLAQTHADFLDRTGHLILERYGMTETNMITSNPLRGDRVAGSVGLPLPGVEVRITEPATADTPPTIVADGQTGMIELRGPNVFAGYWNMPEKTAEELRPDGWFLTGDLGCIDARGYLHIVGRAKDLIITGGYNVYPKEIELMLDALAEVVESAIVGLPHPDLGEAVVAFVVPQPHHPPDEAGLLERISPQLARFKHPRAVIFVAELPRNVMGKVQKAQLRTDYAEHFAD
ncbi:AMP-binding protein [Roseicitreum antarcticum]|uniref:Malonyl-CoA/methylmalonyl-CoA synthetase n=1 Tax=Roseicitreum antarcticum TaxID=564137 RepID=A0A1H2U910_9RHOB|nr:AMP-binding protein [Roseicitreum antarcticum]SDW52427.1 malonyl-CoA/methylmalonyl-CoA synthetase [Roseicitreum antarcticum]